MADLTPTTPTYDFNTGKLLQPGQTQSLYNTETGQKIGTPIVPPTTPPPVQPATGSQPLPTSTLNPAPTATTPVATTPASTTSTPVSTTTPTKPDVSKYESAISSYQGQQQNISSDYANQSDKLVQQMQGIENGTVPLAPYEQAQVDATKASFQSLIQQQQIANQNLIGGTTVANEVMGLSRYSPQLAMGNIFATVTEANRRIADLNTKMSSTLADMETGFRNNDFNKVKDTFDTLTKLKDEKTVALEKMTADVKAQEEKVIQAYQDQTYDNSVAILNDSSISLQERQRKIAELMASGNLSTAQVKDLQGSIRQVVQDDITNKLNDAKFTYQQKQDAIDNAFKAGQITETQRHNMAMEAIAKEPTPAEKKATADALQNTKSSIPIMHDKINAVESLLNSSGLSSRVGPNALTRTGTGYGGILGSAAAGAVAGGVGGAVFGGVGAIPGAIGGALIGAGLSASRGAIDNATGAGQDFAANVHKLVGGLTLDNLIQAKARGATFGALSEGELNILASSATALNDWEVKDKNGKGLGVWNIDEGSFKKELKTIQDLTKRALLSSEGTLVTPDEQSQLDTMFSPQNLPVDPSSYY